MPYFARKEKGVYVERICAKKKPIGAWEAIDSPSAVELPKPLIYNAYALKTWALSDVFTAEILPHMAAFLDFANSPNDESKALFLAYATSVDLVTVANTIINKAIELGAKITVSQEVTA